MLTRILAAVLILFIGVILQIIIGETLGFWINFAFAALVAAAFFLSLPQLFAMILLAVFLLNWQPAPSYELLFAAGFVFLVFAVREIFPWHRWFSSALFVFLGVTAMYAVFAPDIFLVGTRLFLVDGLGAALFGIFAFETMKTAWS